MRNMISKSINKPNRFWLYITTSIVFLFHCTCGVLAFSFVNKAALVVNIEVFVPHSYIKVRNNVRRILYNSVISKSYRKLSTVSESDHTACSLIENPTIRHRNKRNRISKNNSTSFQTYDNSTELRLLSPVKNQVELSPWLSRYFTQSYLYKNDSHNVFGNEWKHQNRYRRLEEETKQLEFKLIENYHFSVMDVNYIMEVINTSIESATSSLPSIKMETIDLYRTGMKFGMIEYLNLVLDSMILDIYDNIPEYVKPIQEILVASIVHFVECTVAQQENVLDIVRSALFQERSNLGTTISPSESDFDVVNNVVSGEKKLPALNPAMTNGPQRSASKTKYDRFEIDDIKRAKPVILLNSQLGDDNNNALPRSFFNDDNSRTHQLSEREILSIARCAGRIKRAEIVLKAINRNPSLTSEEASQIRGLLLTIGEDWRSIALRCVACLFRMQGILETMPKGVHEYQTVVATRTPDMVRTTREGLAVYAILAEQLGLHGLKTRLEDAAFQILYRRQYRTVMTLYNGLDCETDVLQKESALLQSQIQNVLIQDTNLMSQVSSLLVTSRVKEPYSFWRKLLRSRKIAGKKDPDYRLGSNLLTNFSASKMVERGGPLNITLTSTRASVTISDMHDAIALRIIIRARRPLHTESDETLREREEILCYYIQSLLLRRWPILDPSRMKDYITKPKPNGYKSLHFTGLRINERSGFKFPFEVQIRTEEMHEIAEFGVASHWGYKLGPAHSLVEMKPSTELDQFIDIEDPSLFRDLSSNHDLLLSGSNNFPSFDDSELNTKASPYLDALKAFRKDVMKKVYVFVTVIVNNTVSATKSDVLRNRSGTLLCLPMKARVHDAVIAMNIVEIQDSSSIHSLFIFLNGRLATLEDIVCNGDILTIQT